MSPVIDLPDVGRISTSGTGLGGAWKVIVLNDNHNTFEGVAMTLANIIPGTSFDQGLTVADRIHRTGSAVVWTGHKELAEMYWEMLSESGLTMAPLEQDV